ncbi:MAG: FKBP-type peptidyl-prolyl cis-trans isomerase [Ferruginibacter sp.]|nr:FKBP-type peptidyl-prolyl cis-trans isomerase [Ferruginibacter sp.]
MKKWFLLSALSVLMFTACKKDDDCKSLPPTTVASAAETAYLQDYLTTNSITASEKNGMFYSITTQGNATSPNQCSTIGLTYSGNLITGTTDGGVFDATPAGQKSTFTLSGLIAGWRIIFPLVKAGGKVTLYIPPSLAYGAQVSPARPPFVGIPANSYLKFTVSLIDVQD